MYIMEKKTDSCAYQVKKQDTVIHVAMERAGRIAHNIH